jgi:putative restriction endonuclease
VPPKYAVSDYTNVTASQARTEWASIVARPQRTHGKRGPTFTPTEAILCLAAMRQVDHLQFGGSTSHHAASPVPELAKLFQRTPASILAKMANLDGSRRNGGGNEVASGAALIAGGGEGLDRAYLTIIRSARAMGILEECLPDFLGLARP